MARRDSFLPAIPYNTSATNQGIRQPAFAQSLNVGASRAYSQTQDAVYAQPQQGRLGAGGGFSMPVTQPQGPGQQDVGAVVQEALKGLYKAFGSVSQGVERAFGILETQGQSLYGIKQGQTSFDTAQKAWMDAVGRLFPQLGQPPATTGSGGTTVPPAGGQGAGGATPSGGSPTIPTLPTAFEGGGFKQGTSSGYAKGQSQLEANLSLKNPVTGEVKQYAVGTGLPANAPQKAVEEVLNRAELGQQALQRGSPLWMHYEAQLQVLRAEVERRGFKNA